MRQVAGYEGGDRGGDGYKNRYRDKDGGGFGVGVGVGAGARDRVG